MFPIMFSILNDSKYKGIHACLYINFHVKILSNKFSFLNILNKKYQGILKSALKKSFQIFSFEKTQ